MSFLSILFYFTLFCFIELFVFKAINDHNSENSVVEPLKTLEVQCSYGGQLMIATYFNLFYSVPTLHNHLQFVNECVISKLGVLRSVEFMTVSLDSRVYNWKTHVILLLSNLS